MSFKMINYLLKSYYVNLINIICLKCHIKQHQPKLEKEQACQSAENSQVNIPRSLYHYWNIGDISWITFIFVLQTMSDTVTTLTHTSQDIITVPSSTTLTTSWWTLSRHNSWWSSTSHLCWSRQPWHWTQTNDVSTCYGIHHRMLPF